MNQLLDAYLTELAAHRASHQAAYDSAGPVLTTADVALGATAQGRYISPDQVRYDIHRGRLRARYVGSQLRIDRADAERYLAGYSARFHCDDLMTLADVAATEKVSVQTIRQEIKTGRLKATPVQACHGETKYRSTRLFVSSGALLAWRTEQEASPTWGR
jgi:hypothetical protein